MPELFLPFISYAIVTTFTPGPNNITSLAAGNRVGYRRALPYLFGIGSGFFVLMFASGILTDFFTKNYTVIAPWLKWVGVAYMIWLAVSLFLPHKTVGANKEREATFLSGLALQFINVKVILYGITIYSSFAVLIANSFIAVLLSAVMLSLLSFASISLWANAGVVLQRLLTNKTGHLIFNVAMACLLVWCAWSIATH
ncbi:MAG: LysE family transporter [Anaerolineae bacterium]